jgi:hypothetical protein
MQACLHLLLFHGDHEHVHGGGGVLPFCGGCDYDRGKKQHHVPHIFCDYGHDCGPQCISMNISIFMWYKTISK